ncbi:hypothetical protein GCM10010400_62790 [Streptomyces aculeolatus]|uniref:hypothetical protein n=1 Tax=Streptomyces aculeolatus TaxID=270689 RepID=UPI001CED413E|nr:hypothetical protein [Streptomyces aculeolatus]
MTNGDTTRGPAEEPSASVHVTSFTYAHGPVPVADITLDLRRFGDSLDLEPGDLTGIPVCDTCSPLPPEADGLPELIEGIVPLVRALRSGPGDGPVTVAVGGAEGRLAATVAAAMHRRMGHRSRVTATGPTTSVLGRAG